MLLADHCLVSCPVCGVNLVDIGPAPLQEAHVRNCLEGGGDASTQSAKYLVYTLPEESALIGTECEHLFMFSMGSGVLTIDRTKGVICLEEFVKGMSGQLGARR